MSDDHGADATAGASPPNPSQAEAVAMADELVRCGVEHAVLAPGSRSTALAIAFDREPRLALHIEIDERSAAFLALGIAKVSGRPAAVVTTSGTATANLHPAVVEADTSRTPLLVMTADRPPELRHAGANQTIDQIGLYGRAVRWFCEVGVAEDRPESNAYWRSTICRAVAAAIGASGGAAGPVHLNLGFREPTVPASDDGRSRAAPFANEVAGRAGGRPWTAVSRTGRSLPDGRVDDLARRIADTPRGLLVLGDLPGGLPQDAASMLTLARRAGWPVIAEPTSGARTADPVIATAAHLVAVSRFAGAHRPDLVLRVGRQTLSRPVTQWLGAGIPHVLVDPDAAWLDPTRSLHEVVPADPAPLAAALAERLAVDAGSAWLDSWRDADERADEAVRAVLDSRDRPSGASAARDVAAAVPDGTTLVAASSLPIRDLDQFMAPRDGIRVVGNRGASGIDGFVSTALGAALGGSGATVALAGDLSLLHDSNGFLLSPAAEDLDCVFVVVNNDGGGIFHLLPQADHAGFERLFGTPHGRDLASLAGFHHLTHERIDRADHLAPAVEAGVRDGGIRIIEVPVDRHEDTALRREIRAAVADALR